jgi:hypothetical protein
LCLKITPVNLKTKEFKSSFSIIPNLHKQETNQLKSTPTQPATSNQQPATSIKQPATSNQQPATSIKQPVKSKTSHFHK